MPGAFGAYLNYEDGSQNKCARIAPELRGVRVVAEDDRERRDEDDRSADVHGEREEVRRGWSAGGGGDGSGGSPSPDVHENTKRIGGEVTCNDERTASENCAELRRRIAP